MHGWQSQDAPSTSASSDRAVTGWARYEGTGRSLSLKLLQQLRAEGAKAGAAGRASGASASEGAGASGRTFREVQLQEPIR